MGIPVLGVATRRNACTLTSCGRNSRGVRISFSWGFGIFAIRSRAAFVLGTFGKNGASMLRASSASRYFSPLSYLQRTP